MPVDHYENFPVASLLLPRRLRRPIEAIYRFARAADDIADEGDASAAIRLQGLAEYRDELDRIERGQAPAGEAFGAGGDRRRVAAAGALLRDLLDAFAQDVVKKRYADYPELLDYCRRSANPVGRLLLHLAGRASEENLRRSDCICSALQLVNFWQDIAIDWQKDAGLSAASRPRAASMSPKHRSRPDAGLPNGRRCLISSSTARIA
jgi:squalene synthase HpnC